MADTIPPPTDEDRKEIVLDAMYASWNDGARGWDDDVLGVIRLLAEARRDRARLEAEIADMRERAASTVIRLRACSHPDIATAIRCLPLTPMQKKEAMP